MRGMPIAGRAILFMRDLGADDAVLDYRAALNTIPMPVWVRGQDMALRWANRAYLDAIGVNTLEDALTSNAVLERSELDLAEAVRNGGGPLDAVRYALIEGKRRALSLRLSRLPDMAVAGIAVDMTPLAQAEATLRLNADASADMLEALPMAVAVFGADQRITSHNIAYAQMWDINSDWLDTHPTLGEILDRLRDARQLSEQYDFQKWKRGQLQLFQACKAPNEELWYLPGGKSVRVQARPHILGGIFFVMEDITEKLRLETSFRLLNQVQRATLDALDDAIAIFGPDGHLVLHNRSFAKLWQLSEDELTGQPHFRKIANLCEARIGHDGIWSIVAAGVTSSEPERCAHWGKTPRADGRAISLAMSRLPNGATVVTFTDLTDVERFQSAQKEPSHAVA